MTPRLNTSSTIYDAIVVGLGGVGSATLYHLASKGLRALGVEQFGIAHALGSSHGQTRIIRTAYHEGPEITSSRSAGHRYVPLLQRSWQLFEALQTRTGIPCLHQTGCLAVGHQLVEDCKVACHKHGLQYSLMNPDQVLERFPGYHARQPALLDPLGGILESENCIRAHISAAQHLGADMLFDTKTHAWEVCKDGTVKVHDSTGVAHTAKHLILCVGAWSSQLVPELQGYLQPQRQVVAWFEVDEAEGAMHHNTHPVVIMAHSNGGAYYSFPQFGAQKGLKIGRMFHLNEPTSPDAVRREVDDRDIAILREPVADCFPAANGKVLQASTCMFTNTPDLHFLIDKHPRFPQVLMVSACSGHGFKFTSGIGEAAAELALHGKATCDVSMFQLHHHRSAAADALRRFQAA